MPLRLSKLGQSVALVIKQTGRWTLITGLKEEFGSKFFPPWDPFPLLLSLFTLI
jgi:hypothetical protein